MVGNIQAKFSESQQDTQKTLALSRMSFQTEMKEYINNFIQLITHTLPLSKLVSELSCILNLNIFKYMENYQLYVQLY
jgi:hypothetical protein